MPDRLIKDEDTSTESYSKFTAEPFDAGYGHTVGNSLRRVLLSSLEGASITSVKIKGAQHEFGSLPGVVEDITDIVLNLKKVKFKHFENKDPKMLDLKVTKEGKVTAGDITEDAHYEVVNKDQVICTLDRSVKFDCEFEVQVGEHMLGSVSTPLQWTNDDPVNEGCCDGEGDTNEKDHSK